MCVCNMDFRACWKNTFIHSLKSNFSIVEKNVDKTNGSAADLGAVKGVRSDKKFANHWSRISLLSLLLLLPTSHP